MISWTASLLAFVMIAAVYVHMNEVEAALRADNPFFVFHTLLPSAFTPAQYSASSTPICNEQCKGSSAPLPHMLSHTGMEIP